MQFGSDSKRIIPQAVNGILDDSGNVVVSGDTSFGASPLGSAARSQALYGIANANFNLTPNIPENPIVDGSNPLPFWSADDLSEGRITAKMFYNETDQTFAVELNPTAGSASDAFTLTTRSYLLNDSGISLRQKAFATLTKVNSYSSTNQWNLTLSATYYDAAGVSLSSFTIGTAADNVAFTGINGFTTTGTAIVSASAQYVDLAFTLTCALAVTSTVKVQIENILLQTSTGGGGGSSSFIIADTFTSSGSWVKPASVNYLIGVVVAGAGGGGGSGSLRALDSGVTASGGAGGAAGGGSSRWTFLPNLYVGNVGTVAVGIGAGGAGGTAITFTKAAGSGTTAQLNGANGAAGATTTFGSYISIPGAGGGAGGNASPTGVSGGTAGGTVTTLVYGIENLPGTVGGATGNRGTATATTQGFSTFPYTVASVGGSGFTSVGTGSGATTSVGGAGGSAGVCGSGGGAVTVGLSYAGYPNSGPGSAGGWGGGGGAGGAWCIQTAGAPNPTNGTAGAGGAGTAQAAAGGGGGGACFFGAANLTTVAINLASGAGGKGSDGFVAVVYVA